ncbi:EmrB/QacA subfamily drug resistance transporter [Orbus hercynius]|uniref:EmrB/QacA subfamily drug resistance transporter n=1 Tax=Orbus hercynius TaxID=593135 RepID=A0A495RHT2_9GAMM|nr:multidrug transporter subunit MdtD [Orbus hercynius]RKS86824.1 EmrB/QacA subfamily drug resistance transporter [Orbus hercynius]
MSNNQAISPLMYKMMPWIAAIAFFMQSLDSSILNTALPAMAQDLNESPLNMQSAVISYALTVALFIPVSGFLADRFGTRNIFVFAVFLFSAGSLMCALSQSLVMLDTARVIQGIGGSMMVPVSRLALIKSFKRSEFLAALNASTIPGLIGPVIGPVVGGYLVEMASWHWIFLINIPIGVIGIIAGWKLLPNLKGEELHFDAVGIFFVAFSVISITLGLEFVNAEFNFYYSLGLFVMGIVLLNLYILHAKTSAHPIFPLSLFHIRTFAIGISGNLMSRLGISAAPFLVPLLLQVAFGYSAIDAGLILMPMALGSLLTKTLVESLLRRFGYRKILMINTVIVSFIIMAISLLSPNTPIIFVCLLLFCLGAANSLQFTSMNSITLADLPPNLTSSGNSFMAVNQQLAISFGIAIGAVLVRLFSYDISVANADVTHAFRMSFIVLGMVTFLSSFIFHRLHPEDGKNLTIKNARQTTTKGKA